MPLIITLGIVARNEEKYIAKTLESIIEMDFNHNEYEIIVVDGNSDDNTREVAENSLKKSELKYKVLNEAKYDSKGLCFARNLVIDESDSASRYIAFTDADCILDKKWLQELYNAVCESGERIAGAGGPRLIAPTSNKKELVINAFITSFIASGGNPAFSKRNITFLDSIPNYNAIYKKEILAKFRYDEELVVSDDNELNYRIRTAGYQFKYVPEARVYHRETSSIQKFARNMFNYGFNITNTVRKHRKIVKGPLPLTILFLFYLLLLIPLYLLFGFLTVIPLILYFIFALAIFVEMIFKTNSIYSLMVFVLMPVQHIAYALGVIYNFLNK